MGQSEPGTFACDTLFLLGSGITANSWVPVRAAVQEFIARTHPHVTFTDDEQVNFWMAWWVFHMRAIDARKKSTSLPPVDPAQAASLDKSAAGLRENIAASLRVATEHCDFFRLRREFRRVMRQSRWGETVCVLTTNWDRNLEVQQPDLPVMHIHGDVADPGLIYLPSEVSMEPYRSDAANAHMKAVRAGAWRAISGARQLCIYGLSLSPLDAELAAVIGLGLGSEPRETPLPVYICNVGQRELAKVAWRVRAAAHPGVQLDIKYVPIRREPDPKVPEGWYLQPKT